MLLSSNPDQQILRWQPLCWNIWENYSNFSIDTSKCATPNKRQSITWTVDDLVRRLIHAPQCLIGSTKMLCLTKGLSLISLNISSCHWVWKQSFDQEMSCICGLSGPTRPGIHHPALGKHLNFYYSPCFTTYFAIRYVSATRNPGTNQPAAVMCRPLCPWLT